MPRPASHSFDPHTAAGSSRLQDQEFRIACFVPEGASEPAFRATGCIEDEGLVEGSPRPLSECRSDWIGYRLLRGHQGILFLLAEMHLARSGPTLATGTFEILDGTGRYTDLQGAGECWLMRDAEGCLVEVFSGHLAGDP